jgi:rod shape-determining protein MreC
MLRNSKITERILSVALFVLMETAALLMLSHSGPLQKIWLSGASYSIRGWIWGASESIGSYFTLTSQNRELAQENFELQQELRRYRNAINTELQDSLTAHLGFSRDFEYIPASIRKVSRNKQHNYIILNKGSEDGIKPQSGIITSKGVIGIIDAVDRHYSYGISFMNTGMSVSARIGSSGAVGPMTWDGISTDKAILKEISLQNKFAPGDTIWTSGYSSIFPADIPLGIAGSSRIVNGAVNEIEVLLFQDFASLRYVTVVQTLDDEELLFLEGLEDGSIEKMETE